MSDGSMGVSIPITASAISAVLNCLFGSESRSSESTNLGLFSESDTVSSDSMSSSDSSFSRQEMAQAAIRVDREKLSCSICLDLLKDPVTIPCGHSYCMSCINNFWDEKQTHSCPQCRQSFMPRPALMKNTVFAELVEDLKKAGLADSSPPHSYAGPADVACDFCVGRKLKAFKSCLACMASYCELHLQPHFNVPPLKKHKLVEATSKLQENICPRHDEVMKIFCRTDRQCICYLCSMDEHKGHDTVSAAAERAERQTELAVNRGNIQQRIQVREKDVKVLQQRLEAISVSADKAVSDSEKTFRVLICLIEKKNSEVKQKIRSQQKTDESRVKELEEKMQQEISELRRKDSELEKLSSTEDHLHFLNSLPSLSHLSETTQSSSTDDFTVQYYEKMTAAVSEARDKLKTLLSDEWPKISLTGTKLETLRDPEHFNDVDDEESISRGGVRNTSLRWILYQRQHAAHQSSAFLPRPHGTRRKKFYPD